MDWQFYVQEAQDQETHQRDPNKPPGMDDLQTLNVGGEGTAAGKRVTGADKTTVKVVANAGELEALNAVAQHGALDLRDELRSALSHDHVKEIFRIVDRATDTQCRQVMADQPLMDRLQSALDQHA